MTQKTDCLCCGECCSKGGPAIHTDDLAILRRGVIEITNLYAIRLGEPVHDNVKGGFGPSTAEIIKVKSRTPAWTCVFLDESDESIRRCTIYNNRPLECRLLDCHDTAALEAAYAANRITRGDLVSKTGRIWPIIAAHEKRCDFAYFGKIADRARTTQDDALLLALADILRIDDNARAAAEQSGLPPETHDFFFGRPMRLSLPAWGLRASGSGPDLYVSVIAKSTGPTVWGLGVEAKDEE